MVNDINMVDDVVIDNADDVVVIDCDDVMYIINNCVVNDTYVVS